MKKIVTGAIALIFLGAAAMAQSGYSEPDMDEQVVVQQTSSSSVGGEDWVVPLILLALVGVAVASSGDDGYTPPAAE